MEKIKIELLIDGDKNVAITTALEKINELVDAYNDLPQCDCDTCVNFRNDD